MRNPRSIVARGFIGDRGSRSGLPLPLLWEGKAARTQCRGPDRAGADPPECSSADSVIVADGFSCRHQIADGAQREAVHVCEVIAKALGV